MTPSWKSFSLRFWAGRIADPEGLVLSVLLVAGPVFVITIPIGAGWDEETHMIRAWELASGKLIPNESSPHELGYPDAFWRASYRRDFIVRPVDDRGFWAAYLDLGLQPQVDPGLELSTRSVYSPTLLLPQAFAVRALGIALDLPALPIYHISRLLGLLTYTGLAWLAVRIIPFGKWIIAVSVLAPTSVFQAATIGADPISNGIAYVFVGATLAIAYRRDIGWREWGALVLLCAVLFLGKIQLVPLALLPFLITSPASFRMRAGYPGLVAAVLLLGLVVAGGWAAIGYARLESTVSGADPAAQLAHLVAHPISVAGTITSDLLSNGLRYAGQWIAEFGYEYWAVPVVTYPLYLLGLLAALMTDAVGRRPAAPVYRALAFVGLVGIGVTVLALYLADTPVGNSTVLGVQGRYFAPFAPLLLMALSGWLPVRAPQRMARWAVGFTAGSLAIYGAGLLLVYHFVCGSAYFEPGLCFQPVYKNWDPQARYTGPIEGSVAYTQEIVAECDGLREVRVWLDASDASPSGMTRFSLLEAASGESLAVRSVPNSRLPRGDWLAIQLDTDWQSMGKGYQLVIQPEPSQAGGGPRLALSVTPDYDPGRLYVNASPVDADLAFKYGCLAGVERLLLEAAAAEVG